MKIKKNPESLLPSQSPSTHAGRDKTCKAHLHPSPAQSQGWVLAQLGDCGNPCLSDSCCNSWSPDVCKDMDLASFFFRL